MSDKNIYVVDVTNHYESDIRYYVAAGSKAEARSYIAKNMLAVRIAKPSELLGLPRHVVVDAETGEDMGAKNVPVQYIEQIAEPIAVGGTD